MTMKSKMISIQPKRPQVLSTSDINVNIFFFFVSIYTIDGYRENDLLYCSYIPFLWWRNTTRIISKYFRVTPRKPEV
jgi:hypothetical protein